MKTLFTLVVVLGLAAGGAFYYVKRVAADGPVAFRTATIERGDLLSTISATGTVEPEEVVDVGAQVAGKIESLGVDAARSTPKDPKTIDYGSVIQEGTVLARIDDSLYKAQVEQAQATFRRSQADLAQLKAKLYQAEQDWKRAEGLRPTKAIAESDYDLAVAAHKTAQANVAVGDATIEQSKAALKLAETNLGYTVIKSPVQGVIIDRRVNIGQTVVASLNAPSLFLIAKDLRRMQVWASVNEADIGRIRPGLPVAFTVDAYPGETFRGAVSQIRLNATMTQNVVTYTVVVETNNTDLKLLPYLTANLQFEIDKHSEVLLVPNAALRWKPRPEMIAPDVRDSVQVSSPGKRKGDRAAGGERSAGGEKLASGDRVAARSKGAQGRPERGRLWIKDGDFVRPAEIQVGPSDGINTEVRGEAIKEGLEVVIGEVVAEPSGGDATNPFAPKMFKSTKSRP